MNAKFAVITGASAGIGKETAITLASKGYDVILIARRKNRLEVIQQKIQEAGGTCNIFPFDLTKTERISNLVQKIRKVTNKIDVLANIAGSWHNSSRPLFDRNLTELEDQTITAPLDIVKGEILLTKKIIRQMRTNATIINMSGTFSEDDTGWIPDFVAKTGLESFTKMLARELKDSKILVFAIRPYFVWTEAVQKFYPDSENEAMKISKVTKLIMNLIERKTKYRSGEVVEIKP
ncbi:MAG: SDR family oxidoreductase [Patescibacteria group bacterium]|nr:SDR family oxidoreductase [Patescibacteria group bacterium]